MALTYGDFGDGEAVPLEIDQLDILVRHAELVLENALYRKRLAIAR
jgi:hypothetical protein